MNRVDLALGTTDVYWADEADAEWVALRGRTLRRRARFSRDAAFHRQSTAITSRVDGWRKQGEPKGHSFWAWTSMRERDFRRQLHLGAERGNATAQKHLALMLVSDIQEVA
jgi:hypothetical protein